ncbi:MAG: M48 family metalloprotease, partial [Acidobacteriota bacterium]|nr:M48 family metalloprotease [Acidobacteriota bacterium]
EESSPARPPGSSGRRRRRPSGSGAGQTRKPQAPRAQGAPRQRGRAPASRNRAPQGRSRAPADRDRAAAARRPSIPSASELAERSPVQLAGAGLRKVVVANRRRGRTVAAVPGVAALVVGVVVGAAVGAAVAGAVVGAVVGAAVVGALWRGSTRMVLRALAARPVDEEEAPGPCTLVEGLCASMGLGVPELFVVDDPLPNALAVGRGPEDSALVLTSGLVDTLDPVALEGVLAHELSHVKANDVAPATVAAALALVVGLGPATAGIVHRLAGRGREFEADRRAVGVTRYPPGLRQALDAMAAPAPGPGPLVTGRAGRTARWLFTVVLPDEAGHRPAGDEAVGELDAPSVRIAALDEW